MTTSFKLNGRALRSDAAADTSLLTVLANDFRIDGSKYGCGKAQCSACLVLVDGLHRGLRRAGRAKQNRRTRS